MKWSLKLIDLNYNMGILFNISLIVMMISFTFIGYLLGKRKVKNIYKKSIIFPPNGSIGYINNSRGVLLFEVITGDKHMSFVKIIENRIKSNSSYSDEMGTGIDHQTYDGYTVWVHTEYINWVDENDQIKRDTKLKDLLK